MDEKRKKMRKRIDKVSSGGGETQTISGAMQMDMLLQHQQTGVSRAKTHKEGERYSQLQLRSFAQNDHFQHFN